MHTLASGPLLGLSSTETLLLWIGIIALIVIVVRIRRRRRPRDEYISGYGSAHMRTEADSLGTHTAHNPNYDSDKRYRE